MTLRLIALGHKAPKWIEEGCNQYRNRLPKEWHFEERLLKAEPRSEHTPTDHIMRKEAERIENAWKDCTVRIVLDEHGQLLTSREFATLINTQRQHNERTAFVIGGTDGLDSRIIGAAHHKLSLSRFTLTHDLARLVILEQMYRASALLSGHPYHRD